MKKNKGFTLIELLAIIVILAIIAVITVPIILNIIENSKKGAATDSAYGYKEAVSKFYATELSKDSNFELNGEYAIGSNGSISDGTTTYPISISGTIPNSGSLTIEKGTVTAGCIQINEYSVTIDDKKITNTTKGTCGGLSNQVAVVEEFPTVTDSNPGIICGDGETEDYDNSTVCYIYSVEDLVEFSNLVNSGKNFLGKKVQLMNGLDIQEDKSYADVNSNAFGDVNGDSTTSTTLKEELTTGKGFKQIGNNTNTFAGTFEGNTKTIKNLFINRNTENYTGLFGYNEGTIKGLYIKDANITGKDYVGMISGYNTGNQTSLILSGNVLAHKYAGTTTGYNNGGTIEVVTEGEVKTTISNEGASGVGGIAGYSSGGTIKGIYKAGRVRYSNSSDVGRTIGYYHGGATIKTAALNTILVGNSTITSKTAGGSGYDLTEEKINNIAMMDSFLDTYVAGDNNNDDYYYDNDNNGNIIICNKNEKPLSITMSGLGTADSPLVITSYKQLREASYDLTKVYKLNADIDLNNKKPIILGSDENNFTGTFDGNGHKISNVKLIGFNEVGLFGKNTGTIKGLKVENVETFGQQKVGLISGNNTGTITNIIASGSVSAYKYAGLITGSNEAGTIEGIVTGNVTTTISNEGASNIGGIAGFSSGGTVTGIYKSGSITYTNTSSVGRTIGDYQNGVTASTGAISTITLNGNTNSGTSLSSSNGKTYTEAQLQTITPYEEVGLNTTTTGEYRYELDTNNNPTIVKNTSN